MPLPDSPEFNRFLGSLQVRDEPPASPDFEALYVSTTAAAQLPGGHIEGRAPRFPWYQASGLGLDALLKRVSHELRSNSHPASQDIAPSVLALSVAAGGVGKSVPGLNSVLAATVRSGFTPIAATPFPIPTGFRARIGPFTLSQIDIKRFSRRCEKACSSIPGDELAKHVGRLAVERDYLEVVVLNWETHKPVREALRAGTFFGDVVHDLLDEYFVALGHHVFRALEDELRAEQAVFEAAGDFNVDEHRLFWGVDVTRLGLFLFPRTELRGWVYTEKYHNPSFRRVVRCATAAS